MPKMKLSQTYLRNGRKYGPGETEVPEGAVEYLAKMEAAYAERLKTHERPAPVTPGIAGGAHHDPRRLPTPQEVPAGAMAQSPEVTAATMGPRPDAVTGGPVVADARGVKPAAATAAHAKADDGGERGKR